MSAFVLMLLLFGCKMKDETKTGTGAETVTVTVTEHHTNIEQGSDVSCSDSTGFIIRSIGDVLVKYNLKYEIVEEQADDTHGYVFKIASRQDAELRLFKEIFDTEDEAMKKIREIGEEKEREPMEKICNFIFRKDNRVYSINSTENISHIRVEVYDYFLEYFNVSQKDKILY